MVCGFRPMAACAEDVDPSSYTIEEIWKALEERHTAVKSAHVTFTTRQWRSEEMAADAAAAGTPAGEAKPGDRKPAAKWSPEYSCEFWIKGDFARYSSKIPSYAFGDRGVLVPETRAFNGVRMQSLTEHAKPDQPPATGTVASATAFDQWEYTDLLPLSYCFRPLRREFLGIDVSQWQIDPHPIKIDGENCIEVVRQVSSSDGPSRETRVALDPARRFLPVRYSSGSPGKPTVVVDWTCENRSGIDVPKSWKHVFRGKKSGDLLFSGECKLTSFEANPEVSDEFFTLIYPTSASIVDSTRGQTFIVQADGSWKPYGRTVTPVDSGQSLLWLWCMVSFAVIVAIMRWRKR
jgi:hypothetical protein